MCFRSNQLANITSCLICVSNVVSPVVSSIPRFEMIGSTISRISTRLEQVSRWIFLICVFPAFGKSVLLNLLYNGDITGFQFLTARGNFQRAFPPTEYQPIEPHYLQPWLNGEAGTKPKVISQRQVIVNSLTCVLCSCQVSILSARTCFCFFLCILHSFIAFVSMETTHQKISSLNLYACSSACPSASILHADLQDGLFIYLLITYFISQKYSHLYHQSTEGAVLPLLVSPLATSFRW